MDQDISDLGEFRRICVKYFPFFKLFKLNNLDEFNGWYIMIEEFATDFRCTFALYYDSLNFIPIDLDTSFLALFNSQFQINFLKFFILESIDFPLHDLVLDCKSIRDLFSNIITKLQNNKPDPNIYILDYISNQERNPEMARKCVIEFDIENSIKFLDYYRKFKSMCSSRPFSGLLDDINFGIITISNYNSKYIFINTMKVTTFDKDKFQLLLLVAFGQLSKYLNVGPTYACYRQIVDYVKKHFKNEIELMNSRPKAFYLIPFPTVLSTFDPVFLIEFVNLDVLPGTNQTDLSKIIYELKTRPNKIRNIISKQSNDEETQNLDFLMGPTQNLDYENMGPRPPEILVCADHPSVLLKDTIKFIGDPN